MSCAAAALLWNLYLLFVASSFSAVQGIRGGSMQYTDVGETSKDTMQYLLMVAQIYERVNDVEATAYKKLFANAAGGYGVKHYTLTFKTVDPKGKEVDGRAMLIIPWEGAEAIPTFDALVYNAHDHTFRPKLPGSMQGLIDSRVCDERYYCHQQGCCNYDTSPAMRASIFAAAGYAVLVPEYIGHGGQTMSSTFLPTYQAVAYRAITVDAVKAYKDFTSQLGTFNSRLILAGYGAASTLGGTFGAHMEIEKESAALGINVLASFSQSGPFDFETFALDSLATLVSPASAQKTFERDGKNNIAAVQLMISSLKWNVGGDALLASVFDTSSSEYNTILSQIENRGDCTSQHHEYFDQYMNKTACTAFNTALMSASTWIKPAYVAMFQSKTWSTDLRNVIIEPNQVVYNDLMTGWGPKGTVYFCSASTDALNAVYANKFSSELSKKGMHVRHDTFPGDSAAAKISCHIILSTVLLETDWKQVEQELLHGKKPVVKEALPPFKFPNMGIAAITFGSLAIIVGVWVFSYEKVTKKKFPGLCTLWIRFLTKCSILVLIIGLLGGISMSVYGLYASGWSIDVDSNFAGYMTADSPLKAEQDMFDNARAEQTETTKSTGKPSSTRRRLAETAQQSRTWTKLFVYYEALDPDPTHGIFYEAALEEIRAFEERLRNFEGYESYCLKRLKNVGKECDLPTSVINLMYGSVYMNDTTTVVSSYDGTSRKLRNVKAVLKEMANKNIFWFTDKYFGPANLTSQFTKSLFRGGLPLKGYTKARPIVNNAQKELVKTFMGKLYDSFLSKENQNLKHIKITWYEERYLVDHEVSVQLLHDASYSAGSFIFVGAIVLLHLESIFLATMAMTSIILSFPMAYYAFYVVIGVKKMMLLNFVSLFLIMGIGADDVFVMFDTFQQARAVLGKKATEHERWMWTYKEAGGAMLITTLTTCGSFFSNCFSSVKVVREFGLFMGFVVVFNYINVMIIFPSTLVIYEKCCGKIKFISKIRETCKRRPQKITPEKNGQKGGDTTPKKGKRGSLKKTRTRKRSFQEEAKLDVKELGCCEKFFFYHYSAFISTCRYPVIVLTLIMAAFSGMSAVSTFKTSSGPPVVFLEDHNLGRIDKMMRTTFSATSDNDLNNAVDSFPSFNYATTRVCPGYDLDTSIPCSGHGHCDNFICECTEEYYGTGCELKKTPGKLELNPPNSLSFTLVETDNPMQAIRTFDVGNAGNMELEYKIVPTSTLPEWIDRITPALNTFHKLDGYIPSLTTGKTIASSRHTCQFQVTWRKVSEKVDVQDDLLLDFVVKTQTGQVTYKIRLDFLYFTAPAVPKICPCRRRRSRLLSETDSSITFYHYSKGVQGQVISLTTPYTVVPYDVTALYIDAKFPSTYEITLGQNTSLTSSLCSYSCIFETFEKPNVLKLRTLQNAITPTETKFRLTMSRTVRGTTMKNQAEFRFRRATPSTPTTPTITSVLGFSSHSLRILMDVPTLSPVESKYETFTCNVYKKGGELVKTGHSSKPNVTIGDLNSGHLLTVKCDVNNTAGLRSSLSLQTLPFIRPGAVPATILEAPEVLKVDSTSAKITKLNYTIGGAAVTSIECRSIRINDGVSDGSGTKMGESISPANYLLITGLQLNSHDTAFTCTITDTNGLVSSTSPTSMTLVVGLPAEPVVSVHTASKTITATVAPNGQDGLSTTGYKCQIVLLNSTTEFDDTKTKSCGTSLSCTTQIIFTELSNGVEYSVQCTSENSKGYGIGSTPIKIMPFGPPEAMETAPNVTNVIESFDNGDFRKAECTLSVALPADTGGAIVTTIECRATPVSNGAQVTQTFLHNSERISKEVTFVNLVLGNKYTISCRTKNGLTSTFSPFSPESQVVEGVGISDPIRSLKWERSANRTLQASWVQPLNSGGKDVLHYNCSVLHVPSYSKYPGPQERLREEKTSLTSLTFDNLTPGQAYSVSCFAVTEAGKGNVLSIPAPQTAAITPPVGPRANATVIGKHIIRVFQLASDKLVNRNDTGGLPITSFTCVASMQSDNSFALEVQRSVTEPQDSFDVHVNSLPVSGEITFACKVTTAFDSSNYGPPTQPLWAHGFPNAPTFQTVLRASRGVAIKLNPPSDTGGDVVQAKVIKCGCQGEEKGRTPSLTTYSRESSPYDLNVTGLNDTKTYTLRCFCQNYRGAGAWSGSSRSVIPLSPPVPDPPKISSAIAATSKIEVTFNAPIEVGLSGAIESYECEIERVDTSSKSTKSLNNPGTLSFLALANGFNYSVACKANSAIGASDWSEKLYLVPSTVSDPPPRRPSVIASRSKIVVVGLDKPEKNGGSRIKAYQCEAKETLPFSLEAAKVLAVSKGLKLGGSGSAFAGNYAVKGLYAYNSNSANYNGMAFFGTGGTVEEMQDPTTVNGVIGQYRPAMEVLYSPEKASNSDESFNSQNFEIAPVLNGVQYVVGCTAVNDAGRSALSPDANVTSFGIPDSPTGLSMARAGSGRLNAFFSPPIDGGGVSTSNFTCLLRGAGDTTTVTTNTSPILFSGLKNGFSYTLHCNCSNKFGYSPNSGPTSAIPATVPEKLNLTQVLQMSTNSLKVVFSPLSTHIQTGGEAITEYSCRASVVIDSTGKLANITKTAATSASFMTLTSTSTLVANFTATVTCFARNVVGVGKNSSPVLLIIHGVPTVPTLKVEAIDSRIFIAVTARSTSTLFPITNYGCQLKNIYEISAVSQVSESGNFEFSVTNGQTYKARCQSNNFLGSSSFSAYSEKATAGRLALTLVDIDHNGDIQEDDVKDSLSTALNLEEGTIFITAFRSLGGKAKVSFNTIVQDEDDFNVLRTNAAKLPSSFSNQASSKLVLTKLPVLVEDTFFGCTLSSISFRLGGMSGGNTQNVQNFSKYQFDYDESVPSDTKVISIFPGARPSLLTTVEYSLEGEPFSTTPHFDSNPIALKQEFAPATTTLRIRVTAADSVKSMTYNIRFSRSLLNCSQPCVNGVCDMENGVCVCPSSDYTGNLCETFCPGVGNNCNGHGTCIAGSGCQCTETYAGSDCADRVCPTCNPVGITEASKLNGGCNVLQDYTCDCKNGFVGKYCENRTCHENCYGQGVCSSGTCSCYTGFRGEFCDIKDEQKVILKYATEVSFVFGVDRSSSKNASRVIYYDGMDFKSESAQLFLLSVCQEASNITLFDLQTRADSPCWIVAFRDFVLARGMYFPVSRTLYSLMLDEFMGTYSSNKVYEGASYKSDVGTLGKSFAGDVNWVALTFKINVDKTSAASVLLPVQQEWAKFLDYVNAKSIKDAGKARMVSETFTKMDTELGIISSTVVSFLASNLICFICVVIFTGDLVISLVTMTVIILIVITLLGFLFAGMGYTFGAIEAIGVTIFVGMSVDYALHMAHGYHSASGEKRTEKIRGALTHLGVSIIGGAITTAGASIFLFFCHMYLFIQLGTMMFMNTLLALFFSMSFMTAVLAVAGPLSHGCDIYYIMKRIKRKLLHALTARARERKKGRVAPLILTDAPKSVDEIQQSSSTSADDHAKHVDKKKDSAKRRLEHYQLKNHFSF
jgi:hypothetical protein